MDAAPRWQLLWRRRVMLILLVAALLGVAWKVGVFESFGSTAKVHALIDSWGVWAYVLYVVSFTVLMPAGIPAFVWVVPAGLLWPFAIAFPLSLLAIACGSTVGFVFARYVARDWVAARMPPRIRRLDERFTARGLRSVILFRLVFQVGAPTHWLLGLSSVGYWTFLAGTILGVLPAVALVTWYGNDVVHWAEMHGVLAVGILVAFAALAVIARRMMKARQV